MSLNSLLSDLLDRLQASGGPTLLIGFDEAQNWPQGALSTLMEAGLIAAATPTKSLVCDGCEENCTMPVRIIPGSHPRAFIMCAKRDDAGRVPVALERLQQWRISEAAAVMALVAACDDHSVSEQLIRDSLPALPLNKVLSFGKGQLLVDVQQVLQGLERESQTASRNRFAKTGDHWAITYQSQTRTFNNTMGLRYIAWLVQNQGKEVSVRDLYYAINPPDSTAVDGTYSAINTDQLDEMGVSLGDLGDAGDTLTPEGKEKLEQAIRQIQERISDALELGDDVKAAELEQRQEQILTFITAETGLGGKPRKASSNIERLRKAVTKRIRDDIKKVTATLPDLGHHLSETIRTGTQCQYSPYPPVEWLFKPK